jgi:K+-sensing histidine kinase KdpD
MTRHISRDRGAVLAGLLVPLAVAAILLPWRGHWSNTNVALLLVVAVVAVAVLGSRIAGALAAVSALAWPRCRRRSRPAFRTVGPLR